MAVRGNSFTLDTTGEIIAYGEGRADHPNRVKINVTSGIILVGGAAADAVLPFADTDGFLDYELVEGINLWAKASAATVAITLTETLPGAA